jgi:DNA-binding SARP family transcriptional activator
MPVVLELLAGAWAQRDGATPVALERKTAAVLAVLALERSVSRARLSAMVWPDVPERTARANLRQLLRRVRLAIGEEVTEGKDPLRLRGTVEVDALRPGAAGELLAGYVYDDCPELSEWLAVRRQQIFRVQRATLQETADQLEFEGELRAALLVARRLTSLHPESEPDHQRVMRLCHALGDRDAAIEAFHVAERVLRKLCDAAPSEQTRALFRTVTRQSRNK